MSDSHDQWEQYYQQPITRHTNHPGGELSNSTTAPRVATSVISDNSSTTVGVHHLNPQGTVAKPIRRRSRASKRTPTTLLNANASNFRALVQQFTGCHSVIGPGSFGGRKGPLNLSFGAAEDHNDRINTTSSSLISPSGFNYNYNQQMSPFQHQQPQEQKQYQDQQCMFSSMSNNMSDIQSSFDDFAMEDGSLHEFGDESALTGSTNDGYFY